jgi:DNA primase
MNLYDEIRERVSCLDAGQRYGLTVNRAGFALCPWHSDRKPSLKLYGPGRGCYCFSCGHAADVIGLTAELLGLDRVAASRRINTDYCLGLPLGRPPTLGEREEAIKRRQTADAHRDYQAWRDDMTRLLCATYRLGWTALTELPESLWLDAEIEAIKLLPTLDNWLEELGGDMEQQMTIFRAREEVKATCKQILRNMPERFSKE